MATIKAGPFTIRFVSHGHHVWGWEGECFIPAGSGSASLLAFTNALYSRAKSNLSDICDTATGEYYVDEIAPIGPQPVKYSVKIHGTGPLVETGVTPDPSRGQCSVCNRPAVHFARDVIRTADGMTEPSVYVTAGCELHPPQSIVWG